MADIDDLTLAVTDNLAAQKEAFTLITAEDLNIDAAIAKLSAVVGSNPLVQAQITALKNATAAQRANTVLATTANTALAAALGPAPPPPAPIPAP